MPNTAHRKKRLVNCVVIGDSGAGKSTLLGHLLHLCKTEPKDRAAELTEVTHPKGDVKYAWILDRDPRERDLGHSEQIHHCSFQTDTHIISLIDVPGAAEHRSKMIAACSRADVALLVVSAVPEEFENGLDAVGQTRAHMVLAHSLGVEQLIVAVTKMDQVDYQQAVFESVKLGIADIMEIAQFEQERTPFIPVSGTSGLNLSSEPYANKMDWWTGYSCLSKSDRDLEGTSLTTALEHVNSEPKTAKPAAQATVQSATPSAKADLKPEKSNEIQIPYFEPEILATLMGVTMVEREDWPKELTIIRKNNWTKKGLWVWQRCIAQWQNRLPEMVEKSSFPKDALKIEDSDICGRGLFAKRDIAKNTILTEYCGSMLRFDELEEDDRYIASVVPNYLALCADIYGSIGRYANHSCEPNAELEMFLNRKTGEPHVLVKSIVRISKNDEITLDYGPGYFHWD